MAIKSGGSSPARWENSNVWQGATRNWADRIQFGDEIQLLGSLHVGNWKPWPIEFDKLLFPSISMVIVHGCARFTGGYLIFKYPIQSYLIPCYWDFLDYPWSKRSGNQQFSKLHWGPGRRPWCSSGPESLPHWRTRHGPPEYATCCQGYGQPSSAWGAAKSSKYQLIKWLNLVVDMILMIIYTYHS